jgi:hypothetical protein
MKRLLWLCFFTVALSSQSAPAQDATPPPMHSPTELERASFGQPRSLVLQSDVGTLASIGAASVQDQTLPPPVKPKLLPDNMSFMERGLWGENGFFRGIGIASPLTPEARKNELALRRTMLSIHQIGGFLTVGLMATTVYFGQKYLNNSQRSDRDMHQTFVLATIISYSATGLMSVLSPPPLIRRDEVSTTTIHKTLAWVHAAGMVLTPILGAAIGRRGASYYDRARVHQISAYVTTAIFAASMIVITF